ncbi:MAG: YcgN family cysteine cluster protein [Alphaproteobacteria bacterium]
MEKFWKTKKLEEMTQEEWESLCDCCGKCCLNKLDYGDEICWTNTHCRFFDLKNCNCKVYENRLEAQSDCKQITLEEIRKNPRWLPKTCAYWLVDNGMDLPYWHHLVCGNFEEVHNANMSLKGRDLVNEQDVRDFEDFLVDWDDL